MKTYVKIKLNFLTTDKANVTVYPATRILMGPTIPNDGMVNAQETVIMNCTVENHDEWMSLYQGKVEWMKDDQYITTDDDSRYSIEDNQLMIKDLKKSDAGNDIFFTNVSYSSSILISDVY